MRQLKIEAKALKEAIMDGYNDIYRNKLTRFSGHLLKDLQDYKERKARRKGRE